MGMGPARASAACEGRSRRCFEVWGVGDGQKSFDLTGDVDCVGDS
jgi:hypothetical protein